MSISYSVPSNTYAFQRFLITVNSESTAGWSDDAKNRLETVFQNLSVRGISDDVYVIGSNPVYHTSENATDDVIHKAFIVMSTRPAIASFQVYNTSTDVTYETVDVSILRPIIKFIKSKTGAYGQNAYSYDGSDDGPVYTTSITGESALGYFQICNSAGTALSIVAGDLQRGSLALTNLNGFSLETDSAPGIARTYRLTSYLASWSYLEDDGFRSNADDDCSFTTRLYTSNLELRSGAGYLVCAEPVHFEVSNPFLEWFPGGDFTPHSYDVILDGSTDYVLSEDLSAVWPSSASTQPVVLSHGNVNTSKAGYDPYALVWENHSNEVESVRVADDLRNYGCIELGGAITHTRSGETLTMLWGKVNVIREYIIYAGYQFSQVNYLSSSSTPYNAGNLSRFIPYFFVRYTTGIPVSLRNCVRTTATASTGINAVNPSEDFYKATCTAEHWWPEHANMASYDHSNGTLWDCEYAGTERSYLQQNKVVVYPSPKTVTSRGELSFYELQYAGPVVDSHLNFYMGHHGHHADNIYSFRSVAYWNQPALEFSTSGINASYNPSIRTFPSGETYLSIGDFTRYRFFWRMKKRTLTRLNSYDTRYALDVNQVFRTTYTTGTADESTYYMYYFGDVMFRQTYSTTAYYDPRRNTRERLKLFTPSVPFYRLKGNTVHAAFDGAVTGSYADEDIVNSHKFGDAYGVADSFWLPGNQID